MRDKITYPILRCMLGHTNDQQLTSSLVPPRDTWHSFAPTGSVSQHEYV